MTTHSGFCHPANAVGGPSQSLATGTTSIVPQSLLQRYHDLQSQKRALEVQLEPLRAELIRLVSAGTPVEAGALRVRLRETTTRRVNVTILRAVFGRAYVDELQARVPQVVQRFLIVDASR
jgi:hypothetical protein